MTSSSTSRIIAIASVFLLLSRQALTQPERRAIIARPISDNKGAQDMTIRVVCYGLGPIGLGIARLAASRPGIEIVGAIDVDPRKVGGNLAALLGHTGSWSAPNVIISADAAATLAASKPDVVLHATSSSLSKVVD